MRTKPALLFVLLFVATTSFAADPGPAIANARKQVRDKQYADAIKLLQDAVPDASAMPDARERTMALAAIHFYSAVAFTGLNDEWKAKEELEQFFHFSPQTNSIDPAKYDSRLVRWFNEVYESMKQEASSNFDAVYPGYRAFAEDTPKERPLTQWGDGPELTLLGTNEEKAQWRRLTDDDTRRVFIDSFWSRRPGDYRLAFMRRVAFADHSFANEKMRGSMTDRGRVFVLLGPPRVVRQKPLSQREAGSIRSSGPVFMGGADVSAQDRFKAMEIADRNMAVSSPLPIAKATVERWIFSRD
ncbi:MAG: GWxTD domain-containing protein, partial [Thermoanaerobaculia bacterium]